MDDDTLAKFVDIFDPALAAIGRAINFLPDSPSKTEAAVALEQAERECKEAEAEVAKQLGRPICENRHLPEVMRRRNNQQWVCYKCGFEKTLPKLARPSFNIG